MNCFEKTNMITAFEFSEVTVENLVNDNRAEFSQVGGQMNSQNIVRHFFATIVEALSFLQE